MVQDIIWKADSHSACQKYPFFMESEGSLPCSQKPDTGPYPKPAESSSPHRFLSPFPMRATCPAHLNLHSSLLGPNILLNTLFSKILSLCSSLKARDQV
jgi:hypothetical protein